LNVKIWSRFSLRANAVKTKLPQMRRRRNIFSPPQFPEYCPIVGDSAEADEFLRNKM